MKSLVLLSVICIAIQPAAAPAQDSGTVNVQIGNQIDSQSGVNGRLQLPMSTSFQLAPWSYQFFTQVPNAATPLGAMYPWHTRVQVISTGIPLTAPDTWDFTELNAMFAPVQNTADHSPEFQIGTAPAFMSDSNGYILPASFPDFAKMRANLVRYYNTGGFTDYGSQAETYLPAFVSGVTAPVDVLATHFYSSCDQTDLDAQVFATVPGFVGEVQDIYSQLATNPSLAGVPVWVTENNVNADYNLGNGMSACNPGQTFVTDLRGTSPFFAAWRSLVFASLGETSVQALYHSSFGTEHQYGEVDASANPSLSYWVDYYLSHCLPSPPDGHILQVSGRGCCQWTYNGNSIA